MCAHSDGVELLGVRAGFLPPGTPLPSQAKKCCTKGQSYFTYCTKCATPARFRGDCSRPASPALKKALGRGAEQRRAEERASPLQGPQISSHAVMHLISGSGLTFVAALFQCLARLLPPLLSFATCLRGGDKDWTPAASNDLMDLSSRNEKNALATIYSYEGWRHDAELAETMHRQAFDCYFDTRTEKILDTMRRKQQVHNGDRSHEYIRKLDALTPTLSYSGWQDDARCIEWPTDYYRGGCYTPSHVKAQFELMRKKQAEHDGDRSHKHLRELDELVARLARNMQVPSASAPLAPEAPTSSTVLWDADTLPIQRLIEEVLGGKLCALSCLGLQPHLIHPKKNIRARFRVLATRLHPDKASHAQAAEAFIKVRAAHDRLMA